MSADLLSARGATARTDGQGYALRWVWLHAHLAEAGGAPGDVCEVVAAVSRRSGMRLLAPPIFLRIRLHGQDWPRRDPFLAALGLRARLGLPTWTVTGRVGNRRVRIEVTPPPEATVRLDKRNPDGTPAVCRDSERASDV